MCQTDSFYVDKPLPFRKESKSGKYQSGPGNLSMVDFALPYIIIAFYKYPIKIIELLNNDLLATVQLIKSYIKIQVYLRLQRDQAFW